MSNNRLLVLLIAFAASFSQAAEQPGVPAFQVAAPNGQSNVVIGTVHVPHAALRQPAADVLNGARTFVIEHTNEGEVPDGFDPDALAAMFQQRDVRAAWARSLTDQQIARIVGNYNCTAPKPITVSEFETFLKLGTARLVAALAFVPCAPAGSFSRDDLLAQAANARRIPVVGLETQQEIGARRTSIPPRLYEASLRYALNLDLDKLYGALAAAMNRGDFDEVHRLAADPIGDPADRELFNRIMLAERNVAWIPGLRAALDRGRAVVAVGAAHLPGKQGILSLLTQQGYRVEPIILPAAPSQAGNALDRPRLPTTGSAAQLLRTPQNSKNR